MIYITSLICSSLLTILVLFYSGILFSGILNDENQKRWVYIATGIIWPITSIFVLGASMFDKKNKKEYKKIPFDHLEPIEDLLEPEILPPLNKIPKIKPTKPKNPKPNFDFIDDLKNI